MPGGADNLVMRRDPVARILLGLAFVAAWIGYDAWIVSHVVLDPATTRAAAHAVLQTEPVRRGLANALTDQLVQHVPEAAHDPNVRPAVAQALRDPKVVAAFAATAARIHTAVLDGRGDATFTVDGRAVSSALRDALARRDPALAAAVAQAGPIAIPIRTHDAPGARDPRSTATTVAALAIMAALLLATAALMRDHSRRAIARAGRRLAYLAVAPLLLLVALPTLLDGMAGEVPQVAAVLLRAYAHRVTPSAIAFLVAGVSVALTAYVLPRRAAQLEPPQPPSSPYTGPPPRPEPAPAEPGRITEKLYL